MKIRFSGAPTTVGRAVAVAVLVTGRVWVGVTVRVLVGVAVAATPVRVGVKVALAVAVAVIVRVCVTVAVLVAVGLVEGTLFRSPGKVSALISVIFVKPSPSESWFSIALKPDWLRPLFA